MPELPEVHTITQDVNKYASGATITKIITRGDYNLHPENDHFISKIQNKKILSVKRVGKTILFELEDENFMTIHLAMTGRLLIRKNGFDQDQWERVIFKLNKGEKQIDLRFCDKRMFGKVKYLDADEVRLLINKYGPEPLDKNITAEKFHKRIKSKRTNIKNVLLDQSKITGLGNVYATDALWIAKIHPESRTETITLEQAEKLLNASQEVLKEGIKNRGISMSDYVDAFGKKGKQQEFFRIYGKEKCSRCNNQTSFIKLNGRGTYFCDFCQVKDGRQKLI